MKLDRAMKDSTQLGVEDVWRFVPLRHYGIYSTRDLYEIKSFSKRIILYVIKNPLLSEYTQNRVRNN